MKRENELKYEKNRYKRWVKTSVVQLVQGIDRHIGGTGILAVVLPFNCVAPNEMITLNLNFFEQLLV